MRRAISRAGKGTPTWSKKPPAESEECVGSAKEMEMVGAITVCSRGFDVIPSNLVAPKVSNHVLFPHERERKRERERQRDSRIAMPQQYKDLLFSYPRSRWRGLRTHTQMYIYICILCIKKNCRSLLLFHCPVCLSLGI